MMKMKNNERKDVWNNKRRREGRGDEMKRREETRRNKGERCVGEQENERKREKKTKCHNSASMLLSVMRSDRKGNGNLEGNGNLKLGAQDGRQAQKHSRERAGSMK